MDERENKGIGIIVCMCDGGLVRKPARDRSPAKRWVNSKPEVRWGWCVVGLGTKRAVLTVPSVCHIKSIHSNLIAP